MATMRPLLPNGKVADPIPRRRRGADLHGIRIALERIATSLEEAVLLQGRSKTGLYSLHAHPEPLDPRESFVIEQTDEDLARLEGITNAAEAKGQMTEDFDPDAVAGAEWMDR